MDKIVEMLSLYGVSQKDSESVIKAFKIDGAGAALAELYAAGWVVCQNNVADKVRFYIKRKSPKMKISKFDLYQIQKL